MPLQIYDEHVHLRPHQELPASTAAMIDAAREQGWFLACANTRHCRKKYQVGPNDLLLPCRRMSSMAFCCSFTALMSAFGLEVDYFPDAFDEIRQTVEAILDRARSMGLVIGGLHGSVHLLPGEMTT
ncbi:MAG: hypothetical protein Q9P14_08160, partial [candidate division KSB1 bacterium]|nr:hypothetical protein [candidate division KSB1 bacterium]